jgi:hypothetical protein
VDYFYKFGGLGPYAGDGYGQVEKYTQAFQLRRFQIFADANLTDRFVAQLSLEGNQQTNDVNRRFSFFAKTVYLEWVGVFPMSNLQIGLIPTPTWTYVSESIWGYRSIERTITDFRNLGFATDVGASLRGKFMESGILSYHIMVGNGTGPTPDVWDRFLKYYASLTLRPISGVTLDGYIDYKHTWADYEKTTLKGLASYEDSNVTVGIEIVHQLQLHMGGYQDNARPYGASAFARIAISKDPAIAAFGRFDYVDYDLNEDYFVRREYFYTVGFDYRPISSVHFMPNLWVNTYHYRRFYEPDREPDIIGRVTVAFEYR